jgi:NitT/TauT family transport system permease protein
MTETRFISLVLFCTLGLLWEGWATFSNVSSLVLPAPSDVLGVLWQGLIDGFLWPHIQATATATLLGFALGASVGFACGVLLGEVEQLRRVLWPYVLASQVIPKLALGPIFIVWFGFGLTSIVVITALICFFPLLENTVTGLRSARQDQRDLFRMLGASRLQTLWRLKIPVGLPLILSGMRIAIVLALVGAVVGEFITGGNGLGASIIAAQGMMDSTLMFALFIAITMMGLLFYQITILAENWLLRSRKTGKKL